MKDRFEIDRNKLNEIIIKYNQEIQGKTDEEKSFIQEKYIELMINTLGNKRIKRSLFTGKIKTRCTSNIRG